MSLAETLSADALLHMARTRRTARAPSKTLPVPAARLRELVEQTTLHTPSAFNSQPTRVVVLLGADHDRLWDMAAEALRRGGGGGGGGVPDDQRQAVAGRIARSRAAAGSALFFSDEDAIRAMQAKQPAYADRFGPWAEQSCGMQQWLLWTALDLDGLGANLQHYSPLIDQQVAAAWGLPASWKSKAQLVFGGKTGEAGEKHFEPLEERVKFFGEA